MSLLKQDGFDYYTAALGFVNGGKWDAAGGAIAGMISGAYGGQAVAITAGSMQKNLSNLVEGYCGFRWSCNGLVNAATIMWAIYDGATSQVDLRSDTTGHLYFTRGGTVLGTAVDPYTYPNLWQSYQIHWLIDNSNGLLELRREGVTVLSVTGADTQVSANAYGTLFWLGKSGNNMNWNFDDVWVVDTADSPVGTRCKTWLGDARATLHSPSATGSSQQWTPSAGTNISCVDDTTPNDNTDYVYSANVGDLDLYKHSGLPASAKTVFNVRQIGRAYKDEAGARGVQLAMKSGTTTDLSSEIALGASYLNYNRNNELDPNTGNPWSVSAANDLEYGHKVSS